MRFSLFLSCNFLFHTVITTISLGSHPYRVIMLSSAIQSDLQVNPILIRGSEVSHWHRQMSSACQLQYSVLPAALPAFTILSMMLCVTKGVATVTKRPPDSPIPASSFCFLPWQIVVCHEVMMWYSACETPNTVLYLSILCIDVRNYN